MRVGGWSVAAVLAALLTAAAASALRPTTVEGVSRSRRRFTSTTAQDDDISISSSPSIIEPSSIRPRTYSRRIENSPREVTRPRTRGRPINRNTDSNVAVTSPEYVPQPALVERTERNPKKNDYSRIRKRPIERNKKAEDANEGSAQTNSHKNNVIKSRTRQSFRRAPTQSPLDVSSPNIDESKIEVISSTLDEITKMTFKDNVQSTSPLTLDITSSKGTSSTPFTPVSENSTTKRIRSRLVTRFRSSPSDLITSGTISSVSYMDRVTTARSVSEVRDSRKLRYRTRLSEIDTNLTGQGITVANEVMNSSQTPEKNASHKENNTESTTSPKISASTESSLPSSTGRTANLRRPPRGKANFRPIASLPKINTDSGPISEDDNYPESFKALLQAKNSSLQSSSPVRERLSVIASNKVYKTHTPPSQSVNTDPGKTQTYPRFITKKTESAKIDDEEKSAENSTTTTPASRSTNKKVIFKSRSPYSSPRYRKNSTVTLPTKPSNINESSSDQPRNKYIRKLKITTTASPRYTRKFNGSSVARNKPLPRSSYYSRFKSTTTKEATTTEPVPLNATKKINFEITANDAIHENVEKNEIGEFNAITNKTVEASTLPRITPIRNTHSRKSVFSSRNSNLTRQIQHDLEPNTNESKMRMYSESLQKATTASNSIATSEPEKYKGRFSSKYKAPLDKPHYKATVPSITSSTAWLRFYVTDKQLTDSLQEPAWFDKEDYNDLFTLPLPRQNVTPINIHDSSTEMVEGEENQLGPDTNSISFSQTRSTLNSADLKLSESILSSSPLMNVEASHHSPSVTISIFDALAEILTSTPRPQMSSTTEVKSKTDSNLAVKYTLNGVSNSINVNNLQELETEAKFMSTDVNSNRITKPVQITSQTKQNMITRLSSRAVSSSSPNSEQQNGLPIDASNPTPTPISTTPLSARKPFAIKLLYSATDSSTDNLSTTTELTSNRPSTDNPSMVYKTVSDLILSNNDLVSSELTSMLSNNIRDILQNMDDSTRTKVSVEMANLLRTLIPRALSRLSIDTDNNIPNTTPYSLEDIRDTEVEFDPNTEIPQIVISGDVFNVNNLTDFKNTIGNSIMNTVTEPAVNSSGTLEISNTSIITNTRFQINNESVTDSLNNVTLSEANGDTLDSNIISRSLETASNRSFSVNNTNDQDQSSPKPFFTNFRVTDKSSHELSNDDEASIETSNEELLQNPSPNPLVTPLDSNTQKPCDLSPAQLWVLSKKARVLKMIEDIIRDHNREISASSKTVQNVDYISSISTLSEQLAQSNPTMKDFINNLQFTSNTGLLKETTIPSVDSTVPSTSFAPVNLATTMNMQLEIDFKSRMSEPDSTTEENKAVSTDMTPITRDIVTTVPPFVDVVSTTTSQESIVTDSIFTTLKQEETTVVAQPESVLTTTENVNPATTTQVNTDILSRFNSASINETERTKIDLSTNVITTTTSTGSLDIVNTKDIQTSLPKKDYVIFGILPNNTVVRKDPNDDTLESLTEASPYIVYGVLPNNTIIRRFPNGTRVPRVMQKIDVLPISPWSLRNPYSPIHNNPAIVRPQSNLIRLSTNVETSIEPSSNGPENQSNNTVNNNQDIMISSTTLNINNRSSLGADVTTGTSMAPAEKSTASHVLSLRTTTMLPSIDEILLNSISTAAKEEMVLSTMKSSTSEPRILTLDIDPETKQIRTEKPMDGSSNAVFKFIPIDEVTVSKQGSNVLKLASTKAPNIVTSFGTTETQTELTTLAVTEVNTQPPQIIADTSDSVETTTFATEVSAISVGNVETKSNSLQNNGGTEKKTMPFTTLPVFTNSPTLTAIVQEAPTTEEILIQPLTLSARTAATTTTLTPETTIVTTTSSSIPITTQQFGETTFGATETPSATIGSVDGDVNENFKILQSLLQATVKNQPNIAFTNVPLATTTIPTTTGSSTIIGNRVGKQQQVRLDDAKLLQAILLATGQNQIDLSNTNSDNTPTSATTTTQNSSTRSIEDDIIQFEEDTKLLKALLQATGQDPASIRIPTLNREIISSQGTQLPLTTTAATTTSTTTTTTTTTSRPITTNAPTTFSIKDDIRKFQEDAKLLQALLQATGQNAANFNLPVVNGVTSNVRVTNPLTTSVTAPTTQLPTTTKVGPVYTSRARATTNIPPPAPTVTTTPLESREILPLTTAFQPKRPTLSITAASEDARISTTFPPYTNLRRRFPTTTTVNGPIFTTTNAELPVRAALPTARRIVNTITTETPSTSTFSVQEDIVFLNNLKNVLNTDTDDPEKNLANRIVALAVERSLNEIQSGESVRSGKAISNVGASVNQVWTTTVPTTTTTTTTPRPTTTTTNTPSIEDDIKQFQEDTKLLQALIKATGQDPANFNIPTITNAQTNVRTSNKLSETVNDELKLLGSLLESPSPLNEPFDSLTPKPNSNVDSNQKPISIDVSSAGRPSIATRQNVQDDNKLLETLIQIQGSQETTTQKSTLAISGLTGDEALSTLLKQSNKVSDATKTPVKLSTEYGNSNDALLAALLKEQGFGPTTASSLDEQLRLAALLNQVVVTPKARRTTTPPPPPAPRRPVLDGLAWLWQQWRETAPGPAAARPNRRPMVATPASPGRPPGSAKAPQPSVNWFGSGPFVGNAEEKPTSNRIPLEPPGAVAAEQTPGRGQLVSAAINVTRAFSQFLGAAIQGAAQTVQNVIKAGQRAATDVYTSGSG